MKLIKFVILTLLGLFAVIYLLILTYVYFNQESMIFQTTKLDSNYEFQFSRPFEEINIKATDGVMLNGLLFKSKNPNGVVFYLHGNAGTLDTWGDIAGFYTDLDYDIFILDYRGFGKSGGNISSEAQFYSDVSTAYKTLVTRYGESKITIIGYSIGTGPATYLASINHPKTLVLQAPYYSLSELAGSRMPFIPNFVKKYKFETNTFITKTSCPIYIFHGDQDQVIGVANSERLGKLLKKTDKLFILNGQGHIDMNSNATYLSELKHILKTEVPLHAISI